MKWILDHLQLIFVVGGALAWLLNQRKQGGAGEDGQPLNDASSDDSDSAERTRKIREDIQRRIEQRTGGYDLQVPIEEMEGTVPPPPIIRKTVTNESSGSSSRYEVRHQAEILEEQASLMEKLQEAEYMKVAAEKRADFVETIADHQPAARALARSAVLGDLRAPVALRRAFILREVLGPPVALRR